ncbi:MAG: PQQ-binding-like beta-propeller repeat protein [Planctomycetales bacterium]|nr:PQQ-binding-like beta-propeller repeat protein [Planctomycetales bacterium]
MSQDTAINNGGSTESARAANRPAVMGGWLPGIITWLLILVLGGAIIAVRYSAAESDQANVNVFTLILGFGMFVTFGVWFVFRSAYPMLVRLLAPVAIMLSIAVWFALYEIDHVDGNLIPHWKRRGAKAPDELLAMPEVAAPDQATETPAKVDLATTTAWDFPQFLGPNRDLQVTAVKLSQNWDSDPPQQLWRQPIGAGWSSFAAVNGFAVTLEQRGDEELVTCYEVKTGTLQWSHAIAGRHETKLGGIGPRSTPTIDGGQVYAMGPTGVLRCLQGTDGSLIWQQNLLDRLQLTPEDDGQAIAWGRSGSPLVVDDLVVVPYGGPTNGPWKSLAAFDKQSGEPRWEAGKYQASYASPQLATLAGRRQILLVSQDWAGGYDPENGSPIWSFEWPGSSSTNANTSQAMPVGDDEVLLSKGYGGGSSLLKLSPQGNSLTATEVWHESGNLKTKFTNAVVADGYAYGLSDGILECVDLATGDRQWKSSRGRYGHGQILWVSGLLLVQAESGEVALVEASPNEFKELGRLDALSGKTWNNLCLYGPYLLVRNAEEAACYELSVESGNGL